MPLPFAYGINGNTSWTTMTPGLVMDSEASLVLILTVDDGASVFGKESLFDTNLKIC